MALKALPLRIEQVGEGTAVAYGGRWRSARPSRIATLPVGYGDGWSRAYSPGGQSISAEELARARNTISYEIVTTMAQRIARVYHAGSVLRGLRTLGGEWRADRYVGSRGNQSL